MSSPKLRVLVVDDEPRIREILKKYLLREGFEVGEAPDGPKATEAVQAQGWDAVVLDIMLPGMDGWQVCREIRRFSEVPILMLTARGEERERISGLEMGADDYIVKPFSPKEVVARIKAIFKENWKKGLLQDGGGPFGDRARSPKGPGGRASP